MGRYISRDPSKGGGISWAVLSMAATGSVLVLGTSIFLAVFLTQQAISQESQADPPPAPLPDPPVRVNISSEIQMAMLFLHAQKSGSLPADYPVTWRGDSGLSDGLDQNRGMSGGFYTGGSGIKHHFPLAFSVTMLSWALLEYPHVFRSLGLDRDLTGLIRWGTDYLLQTRYENIFFPQVGSPDIDHDIKSGDIQCWMRPEDMQPEQRPTMYPCDCTHPCSDLAGEYAAAFAAASLVYRIGNPQYADFLAQQARSALQFADTFRGSYSAQLQGKADKFQSTSFEDEILWGAVWLYLATNDTGVLTEYLLGSRVDDWQAFATWDNTVFDWNNKWPGVQVLVSRFVLLGGGSSLPSLKAPQKQKLAQYVQGAEAFACFYAQSVDKTPTGNLMWLKQTDHSLQYPINAGFLSVLLSEYESGASAPSKTPGKLRWCNVTSATVQQLFAGQRDYILGNNPMNMSYMVGYMGPKNDKRSPGFIHHRGSSIPATQAENGEDPTCRSGLQYLWSQNPNPNVLVGAIVGGPDIHDNYIDTRENPEQSEPYLHVNAVFIGLLAALNASSSGQGNNLTRMFAAMQPGPAFDAASKLQDARANMSSSGSVASISSAPSPPLPGNPPSLPLQVTKSPAKRRITPPAPHNRALPPLPPSPPPGTAVASRGKWPAGGGKKSPSAKGPKGAKGAKGSKGSAPPQSPQSGKAGARHVPAATAPAPSTSQSQGPPHRGRHALEVQSIGRLQEREERIGG